MLTDEVAFLRSFRHENIVKYFGLRERDGFIHMFMEYLEGVRNLSYLVE